MLVLKKMKRDETKSTGVREMTARGLEVWLWFGIATSRNGKGSWPGLCKRTAGFWASK